MRNTFVTIHLGITTVYLIRCKNGYLLIDTGYKNEYKNFIKKLKTFHIAVTDIKYILLTHAHDDHAGFVQLLKEECQIPLIVQQQSVSYLKLGNNAFEVVTPANKRIQWLLRLIDLLHKDGKYPPVEILEQDIVLTKDNSSILDSIGIEGKILLTPGHTSDSITVILEQGDVFCGDCAMHILKVAGLGLFPILVNDRQEVLKSWRKIIDNGARKIYPSHGKPFLVQKLINELSNFEAKEGVTNEICRK